MSFKGLSPKSSLKYCSFVFTARQANASIHIYCIVSWSQAQDVGVLTSVFPAD